MRLNESSPEIATSVKTEGPKPMTPRIPIPAGARAPSYPDRQRLDSDVRALLRQPSTPWITFDKDSRVDRGELRAPSHLSAGEVLRSSRSTIAPDFEAAVAAAMPDVKIVEPSGLSVASDVLAETPPQTPPTFRSTSMSIDVEIEMDEPEALSAGVLARGGRSAWVAIAGAATLFAIAGVLALRPASPQASAAAQPATTTAAAPARAAEEIPPPAEEEPALDAKPVEAPKVAPVKDTKESKDAKHSKFGRLAIRGDARFKNVFFDGKRMLGKGSRAFPVLCGDHTIAVGDKTDVRQVEVPCDGELLISR
jgi:hypothetical protein